MDNIYTPRYIDALGGFDRIHPHVQFGDRVRMGTGVVIERGCRIGANSFIGHYAVLRPGTVIGADCVIGHHTVFEGECVIGNRVLIHAQCHITKDVTIEDDVFIAPMFCGANTPRIVHGRKYALEIKGFKIKRAARIGIGVLVAPGVVIGENAQIGMGAVVLKDVPDGEVWYGNPAKFVRKVRSDELL